MNANNENGKNETNNQINEREVCLLCGRKKQEKNIVCWSCYQRYQGDLIASVAENLKEISILEWTVAEAKKFLGASKEELSTAQAELTNFKDKIYETAYTEVKGALKTAVPKEVFSEILNGRRQKLWQEGGGDKLYGQLKCLELRAKKLPSFIEELEKKLAEREQKSSGQKPEKTNEE